MNVNEVTNNKEVINHSVNTDEGDILGIEGAQVVVTPRKEDYLVTNTVGQITKRIVKDAISDLWTAGKAVSKSGTLVAATCTVFSADATAIGAQHVADGANRLSNRIVDLIVNKYGK